MRHSVIIGCALVWLAMAAAPAEAQLAGPTIPFVDGRIDVWPRAQFGGELGVHAQEDFVAESILLGGWYRITPEFALEGSLGFFNASAGGSSEGSLANPFFAAYYVRAVGQTMFRVGGGIAPGLASEDSPVLIHWFMRGLRDLWLVLPNSVSFVPRFRLDSIVSDAVVLGFDVDIGMHVSTEGGDTEVTAQAGFDFTGRIGTNFQLGARLQFGSWLTVDGDDAFQSSLVPFLRAVFGAGYVEARLLVNFDEPAGFLGRGAEIWTLYVGGGARL